MKRYLKLTVGGFLFLTGNFLAQGQFLAPGGLPAGFHHALMDVVGNFPAFMGHAQIQISNGPDKDPTTMGCDIAVLSGAMRVETDAFYGGGSPTAADAAQLRAMHTISILRPDLNRMYLIFPAVSSYIELAYSKSTGTDPTPAPSISKSPPVKDSVGDEPCEKSQWQVTEANGEHYEVTVWLGKNWNDFPIKIKLGAPESTVQFQNLHFQAPDSASFGPPAGYVRYAGIQEIIRREAEKAQTTNAPATNK